MLTIRGWKLICNGNGCQDLSQRVSLESRAEVLAGVSLCYLIPLHWPTHRTIARAAMVHLASAWQCMRNFPRDGVNMRNDRCTFCGWLTGNRYIDEEQCYECHNVAVCAQCTYQVPGKGTRCFECDLIKDLVNSDVVAMKGLSDHVADAFDAWQGWGEFHPHYVLPKLAFRSWKLHHRDCKKSEEEERRRDFASREEARHVFPQSALPAGFCLTQTSVHR